MVIMNDKYPAEEFDQWASSYDKDIYSGGFPFSGYEDTLDEIVNIAHPQSGMQILDMGVGTGNLAARFLAHGCDVTGIDFSTRMIEFAKNKYPDAEYYQADLRSDFSSLFSGRKFDRIVSAYTFHHFSLPKKTSILLKLLPYLDDIGFFIIGDIAFNNRLSMKINKERLGSFWEEEDYWLADESVEYLSQRNLQAKFTSTSRFAGVFCINPLVK